MTNTSALPETQTVLTYSFSDFCKEAQKYLEMGYSFDFNTNANYPSWYGSAFSATLVLPEKEQNVEKVQVTKVQKDVLLEPATAPTAPTEQPKVAAKTTKVESAKVESPKAVDLYPHSK